MPKAPVKVFDKDMKLVALLENAYTVGYEMPMNGLWTATFSLPASDPKNTECQPLRFVEIYDDRDRIDLFRIFPANTRRSQDGRTITYTCQHVLSTLLDDVLFQFHTVGNLGVYTHDVIEYILSRQTTQRWQLGTVDIQRQFEYNFENTNLLSALFSVPKPFIEEYMWTWDTTSYPWTLNLVEPPAGVQAYIKYGINMKGIERKVDPSGLVTRLYGLGYGEGVNQLTIADVNGGLPYLDADTQVQYGIRTDIFVDRRFMSAETLKARMEALLNEVKHPRYTYTVQASEAHRQTGQPIHKFKTGNIVRTQDSELKIDFTARIVNVRKSDIFGQPGEVEIEISNKRRDVANLFNELQSKLRINETYAQGATNIDSHDFADNCDPTHPAILRFYIPQESIRINKIMLSYQVDPFRAYERAIAAAPATTSGPSSEDTTGASSITTTGPSNTQTTETSDLWNQFAINVPDATSVNGGHTHDIEIDGQTYTTSFDGSHAHALTSDHRHDMLHTHDMPHTHGMDHTHEIPAHTHGIEFGIFEGPAPTLVTVRVDGNVIPGLGTSEQNVDIIPYLSKDSDGKINRGAWHEISITPNSLGRIVASVIQQVFVNSRGGGDY